MELRLSRSAGESAGSRPDPSDGTLGTDAFNDGECDERLNLRVHPADNSLLSRSTALEVEQPMRPNRWLRIPICRNPRRCWASLLLEIYQTY